MKITILEPEHRCTKCKTPLDFISNYLRRDAEIEEIINKKSFFKKLFSSPYDYMIDKNRQYWECPKCHEEYLVDLRGEK